MATTPESTTPTKATRAIGWSSMWSMLKDAWQIPLLVVGAAGIVGAAWYARAHRAENEWNATLEQATEQIDKGELGIAHVILDEVIAPHLAEAPDGFVPRFDAVRADLASSELAAERNPSAEAFEAVAKRYEHAIEAKAELTDAQLERYSAALVGAGRSSEAIAAAEQAGDAEHAQKLASRFGRKKLEDAFALAGGEHADAKVIDAFFAAYEEFRGAPRIAAADRAWAATLAARVRLRGSHAEAATERLLLELPRAQNAEAGGDHVPGELFAELWYLLGEGYRQQGRHADAEHALETAHGLTQPSSYLAGEIDLALGRVKLALDAPEQAHGVFDRAVLAEHPEDLKPGHMLGRARARAALERTEDALRDFDALLALAEKNKLPKSVADEMLATLNDIARSALGEEHFVDSIAYAGRAVELGGRRGPQDSGAAAAYVTLAEGAYRRAREMRDAETEHAGSVAEIEPGSRAEINGMYRRAGEAFASFLQTDLARELAAPERSELHFSAGDSFDCGGEHALALGHFERSLAELPEGDSKRTERLLRIGDIHAQAQAFDKAQDAYEGVYKITRNDPRVAMPLCKVLVAADQVPRALAELRRILEGNAGLRPDSEQYREALDLYAKLSFARGDFGASADKLTELVERDPDHAASGERHFRLGQSLQEIARLAAAESKGDDLTTARRAQLERSARERAVDAQRAYQRSIEVLESRTRSLDGLGRDMLRNAYLQRAHCAFDRGQFKEAIDFYETVDRKFPDEAASVLALVQIVNAADALGDAPRAEAAHTRALRRIDSLPDDALLGDGGVLGRDDWRNWLRNHPPGSSRVADAGAEAGGGAP